MVIIIIIIVRKKGDDDDYISFSLDAFLPEYRRGCISTTDPYVIRISFIALGIAFFKRKFVILFYLSSKHKF